MPALGLYLHIPFCKSKCLYCDFCSFPRSRERDMEAYVEVLCKDLEKASDACRSYSVDTVYLGGGTPTLLPAHLLEKIMETVTRCYRVDAHAEITAECNPATADADLFGRMRRAGWNRLSIGVQSAQTKELKALGRLHSFEQFLETWETALSAGFPNLSADVMFGIPYQTKESFADTLEKVLVCNPNHLSAYSLTVEEGTPFGRRGESALHLPNEDLVREMYLEMVSTLDSAGVKQYEISNFARQGYESRHNLKYWNMDSYLGFGVGAYSDFSGERFGNGRDFDAYLRGEDITAEREAPDRKERLNEYVMLQMRLRKGISRQVLADRFGDLAARETEKRLLSYVADGFVEKTADGYAFTVDGMLVSNSILSEILEFGE